VLSIGDSRTAHRVSDFRHSHTSLISLVTSMYGKFGTGNRGSMFGLDDKLLHEALQDYTDGKVRIPTRAATASVNKEVEKQNLILLKQALEGHNKNKSALLQAITQNAQIPPYVRKFMIGAVESQDAMMKKLIREFMVSDQPEEYVQDVEFPPEMKQDAQKAEAGKGSPDARVISMARAVPPAAPGVPSGAIGGVGAVREGFAGATANPQQQTGD
jgi:hypothetical protein